MFVWQLHQGHQQQLQGEDTRQENLWQSPSKAKGLISHLQPRLMDSFPNEAFDLFILSPHHTEDSFNSFGHWGIAKVAAKLSSQSSSICGKMLPLQFSFCQLPWAEEEEEDDNDKVVMKGLTEMLLRAGLHCLLFRTFQDLSHIFWHPKIFQDMAKQMCFLSYYLLLSLLLWCVLPPAHALPPLSIWNPKCREQAVPRLFSWGRSTKAGFSHHGINLWSNLMF